VSSVTVPTDGTFVLGDDLDFVVTFDDSVTVVTTGGTPRIELTIGGSTVYAEYVSGSGTTALTFRYTTQAGDTDSDGISVGALSANGGTLRDATGNDATLTLNGVGATTAVLVNTAPTVALTVNNATIAEAAGTSTVTATLSAAVAHDTTITLTPTGTATDESDYTLSSTTITITAGQTTGTATLTAVQDTSDETNETIIVDISNVSSVDDVYESGTQQVTVTITDDDATPAPSGGGSTPPPTTSTIINEDNLTGVVKTTPVTETVGNTTVTTQTATATRTFTDANGETITQTNKTVQAVEITAPTSGNSATTSVPLYWGESTQTEWATTASVSSGVTLASEGNRAPSTTQTTASAIDDLIYYIQTTVPSTDSTKSGMLSGGSSFLSALNNVNTLVVNKVVLSTTSTTSTTPSTVSLDGTATAVTTNGVTETPKEALVIDGSSLSSGSTVSLSNIEFGVLTGANLNVVMTGTATQTVFTGAGIQTLTTSSSTQNQLYAGGGDDTFHVTAPQSNLLASERALSVSISESFANTIDAKTALYGEEGDDNANVEGNGTLNTFVHGGSGSDSMNYQGSINDYTITHDEGITYVRSNATSKTDILLNVESIQFDDQTYTITNDTQLTQIASLYQSVLDRQAEVDGFQYWAHSYNAGESMGSIATNFVRSSEYFNNTNNAWDSMNNDTKIEVFYQLMLGRASDSEGKSYWMDAINNGILTIEQIAESFVESVEMQGIYTQEQGWNFSVA
jgi:hypothetical protein